jgi:hypothetical protein
MMNKVSFYFIHKKVDLILLARRLEEFFTLSNQPLRKSIW